MRRSGKPRKDPGRRTLVPLSVAPLFPTLFTSQGPLPLSGNCTTTIQALPPSLSTRVPPFFAMTTAVIPPPAAHPHHHQQAQPAILVEMPPSPALTADDDPPRRLGARSGREEAEEAAAGKLLLINTHTHAQTPQQERPQSLVSLTSSQRDVAVAGPSLVSAAAAASLASSSDKHEGGSDNEDDEGSASPTGSTSDSGSMSSSVNLASPPASPSMDLSAASAATKKPKGLRRMSRKQAPAMTESLVDLSAQLLTTSSSSSSHTKDVRLPLLRSIEPVPPVPEKEPLFATPLRVQRGASEPAVASPRVSLAEEQEHEQEAQKRPSLPVMRNDNEQDGPHVRESFKSSTPPVQPPSWRRGSAARLFARKPAPAATSTGNVDTAERSSSPRAASSDVRALPDPTPVSPKSQPRALPLLNSVSRKFSPVIPTRWQSLPASSEDPSSEQAKLRYHYQPRLKHDRAPGAAATSANYPYFHHAASTLSGFGRDNDSLATVDSEEGAQGVVLHVASDDRRPSDGTFTSEFTLSPRPHRERNGSRETGKGEEWRDQPTALFSPVSPPRSSPSPPQSPPAATRTQPSAFGFGKSRSMQRGLSAATSSAAVNSSLANDSSSQTSSQTDGSPSTPTLTPTQTRTTPPTTTSWSPRGVTRTNSAAIRAQRNASVWSTLEALEAEEQLDKLRLEQAESHSPHHALRMRRFTPAGRREKKTQKRLERQIFEAGPDRLPSAREMLEVSEMEVYNAEGDKVTFGQILGDGRDGRKTIVIFIRHWYCPLCGQYVDDIVRSIDKDALEAANVDLVVIGLGSPRLLPAYSRVMKCPFRMYTDPTLKLYRGLGMTLKTFDEGPEEAKGDYIVKTSGEATLAVMKRAIKMPLGMPGSVSQLGGEFIFQGNMTCMYAHRMTNTRAHAPIRDVAALAGVKIDYGAEARRESGPSPPPLHRQRTEDDNIRFGNWGESGLAISPEERLALEARVDKWRVEREKELERIRLEREERRAAIEALGGNACSVDTLSL